MHRFVKTLLLWLLIAGLPLQGLAAVTKMACGAVHGAAASHHASPPAPAAASMHHHEHAAHHAEPVTELASAPAASSLAGYQDGYCSACSACCFGAWIPPSELKCEPMVFQVATLSADAPASFVAFIPPGLERPPRPTA